MPDGKSAQALMTMKLADFRQLQAIFSSEGLGCDSGGFEGQFALFEEDGLGIFEAASAVWAFAQSGVAGLGIPRTMPCSASEFTLFDSIANAHVHTAERSIEIDSQKQL